MATWTQIINLRLEICDPYGVIDIIEVVTKSALPASPKSQTAYKVTADGAYYRCDVEADAVETDYNRIELQLSDSRLEDIIDKYGAAKAISIALKGILKRIGLQFPVVRSANGAESTQYQSLIDLYNFYKGLAADADEQVKIDSNNTSGRFGRMKQPKIAGGNL
jgi:hypothetical protein